MQDRIALAIVVAGALVGAGLFFGLRGRAPASAAPAAAVASTNPVGAAPTAPTPAAAPPRATPEKVRADGIAALEEFKGRVMDPCWRAILTHAPQPARSSYSIDVTFGADGSVRAFGLSELRERPSRPDVAQCIRTAGLPPPIPPPGGSVRLELPLDLP